MADRSGYIGRAPGDSSVTIARQTYTPTGVQTDFAFASSYTPGLIDVYFNGAKLIDGTDYTATDGSSVSLTTNAVVGDVLEMQAYKAFNLGQISADLTGSLTINQNLVVGGTITGDGSGLTGVANTETIDTDSIKIGIDPGSSVGAGVTINMSGIIVSGNSGDFAGVITARAFDGDGSQLTGISGFGTALSTDTTSILSNIFKTPWTNTIASGQQITITNADGDTGRIAFTRLGQIHVATGATIQVSTGTTFVMNCLNIF